MVLYVVNMGIPESHDQEPSQTLNEKTMIGSPSFQVLKWHFRGYVCGRNFSIVGVYLVWYGCGQLEALLLRAKGGTKKKIECSYWSFFLVSCLVLFPVPHYFWPEYSQPLKCSICLQNHLPFTVSFTVLKERILIKQNPIPIFQCLKRFFACIILIQVGYFGGCGEGHSMIWVK